MNELANLCLPSEELHLPLFDIRETRTHYLLTLNLKKTMGNDIEVRLTEGELLISGRGRSLLPDEIPKVSLRVYSEDIDLSARYRGGYLIIAMPKAPKVYAPFGTETMKVAP
jgi:HSP20 family molecular chaperone IbpA